MSSDLKKADPSQSAEQKRRESEEQLSLLQTITRELATADDLSSALRIVLRQICEKNGLGTWPGVGAEQGRVHPRA